MTVNNTYNKNLIHFRYEIDEKMIEFDPPKNGPLSSRPVEQVQTYKVRKYWLRLLNYLSNSPLHADIIEPELLNFRRVIEFLREHHFNLDQDHIISMDHMVGDYRIRFSNLLIVPKDYSYLARISIFKNKNDHPFVFVRKDLITGKIDRLQGITLDAQQFIKDRTTNRTVVDLSDRTLLSAQHYILKDRIHFYRQIADHLYKNVDHRYHNLLLLSRVINHLINLIDNGELYIPPRWQHEYQWQRSQEASDRTRALRKLSFARS